MHDLQSSMLNIIALCSGEGGTIKTLKRLMFSDADAMIKLEVISDRECGALEWAKAEEGVESTRIEWMNDQFNLRQRIEANTPCIVLTLIHRILSPEILSVNNATYINTHYSLLPSFGGTIGMKSLKRAVDSGCVIVGASSHRVTEELDSGPIIAQVAFARRGESVEELQEIMFKCGCISTLMAIHKEAARYNILNKAANKYIELVGRDIIIGF